ncbi:hypothetical protein A3A39_00330 [Candidatus Kaiserbacteria bacterium RIFCSPLOWO2_01_FULL_54_13]|uniref:DUF403 domain-containing protein n=1 Tax=Candidatus Kaiserbacteria bacterium RIFCSPLOWO2_01_FULL_54_13 TaxID=1798512 RepID=A0A1F6F3U7_9BACT|nr:MAG: hypothetical protein A3A39_00330 [Candidatus Kaiserbacteria bacterium RIFCSPLOWO2_01_FULL_54_13]
MTHNKAAFYFANLGADVLRCALAAESKNAKEYHSSLDRAYSTLRHIEKENRHAAYEEGILLLRGLEYARASRTLPAFREELNAIIEPFAARLSFV